MDIICEILQNSEYDKVINLAVEVFMNDKFFIKQFPDYNTRQQQLKTMYQEAVKLCADNFGNTLIAKTKNKIVGFLMFFDYMEFRKSNLEDFKKIFGIEIKHNSVLPTSFAKIHKQVVKSGNNPIYVLAIGVGKKYQHQGIGKFIFTKFLQHFENRVIMSDISGPFFLRLCQKCGFDIKPLSEVCYLAIKSSPTATNKS